MLGVKTSTSAMPEHVGERPPLGRPDRLDHMEALWQQATQGL